MRFNNIIIKQCIIPSTNSLNVKNANIFNEPKFKMLIRAKQIDLSI